MEFRCEVCKRMRPHDLISVHKVDLGEHMKLPAGSFMRNVNYCNDNNTCYAGAIAIAKKEQER